MSAEPDSRRTASWVSPVPDTAQGPRRPRRARRPRPVGSVLAALALDLVGILAADAVLGLVILSGHPGFTARPSAAVGWAEFGGDVTVIALVAFLLRREGRVVVLAQAAVLVLVAIRFLVVLL